MNVDFDESVKEFWAFMGRKTKNEKWNIASLRYEARISVINTKGKLEALCS